AYRDAGGNLAALAHGLIRFHALDAIFATRALMLQPALDAVLQQPSLAGLFAPVLVRVLRDGSANEKRLVTSWLTQHTQNKVVTGSFLLKVCADAGVITDPSLKDRAAALPPLPKSDSVIGQILADKKIVAKLFYYPDENAIEDTAQTL